MGANVMQTVYSKGSDNISHIFSYSLLTKSSLKHSSNAMPLLGPGQALIACGQDHCLIDGNVHKHLRLAMGITLLERNSQLPPTENDNR